MARNKYPEETVKKILKVSKRLFLEKGYEQTTIQDIVDNLDGLTKGAIYHHFKSKEEILLALEGQIFENGNVFSEAKAKTDLNGLEKLQYAVSQNQAHQKRPDNNTITEQYIPLLKNPYILAKVIDENRKYLSPCFLELIQEGEADGSICTKYDKEIAELIPLLELWLMPSIYPATAEEQYKKLKMIQEVFSYLGVPIFSDAFIGEVCSKMNKYCSDAEK